MKRLSILFFAIRFFSGECAISQNTVNSEAKKLTDSAQSLGVTRWALKHMPRVTLDSLYKMKVSVLNQAISVDSNYFDAIYYKYVCLNQLKDDRDALPVAKKALQLRPGLVTLKYEIGLTYDRVLDSISARQYYKSFLSDCDAVLDTMRAKNKQYIVFEMYKINVLILLGEKEQSRKLIKKAFRHSNHDDIDDFYYKFYMNRTRADMINKRDIVTFHHLVEPE